MMVKPYDEYLENIRRHGYDYAARYFDLWLDFYLTIGDKYHCFTLDYVKMFKPHLL